MPRKNNRLRRQVYRKIRIYKRNRRKIKDARNKNRISWKMTGCNSTDMADTHPLQTKSIITKQIK